MPPTDEWKTIRRRWQWRPIHNCPGRYVLAAGGSRLAPTELLERRVAVHRFHSAQARDPVLVAPLCQGGLISYKHEDGSFVHTLNTQQGFARKLAQLDITLGERTPD